MTRFAALMKQYSLYDFTLECPPEIVMTHSLDLVKLRRSIDQSLEIFGRHPWHSSLGPSLVYSGFSLTFNPHLQEDHDPHASSQGSRHNHPKEFFYSQTDKFAELKDSYFDSYGFCQLSPAAEYGYLGKILHTCKRTIIRSRLGILDGRAISPAIIEQYEAAAENDSQYGWHRDEPIWENLRINIPIFGGDEFAFQLAGSAPYHLEPGYAYSWNTNLPHRVYCRRPTTASRMNLVIGIAPWFDYDFSKQQWAPNQFFKKKHPFEMLKDGDIFDWLSPSAQLPRPAEL